MIRHETHVGGAAGHSSRRLHIGRDEQSELVRLGIAKSPSAHPSEAIILDLDGLDAAIAALTRMAADARSTRTTRESLRPR